jgi:N6-adenosine-specific RNA methylase IME4
MIEQMTEKKLKIDPEFQSMIMPLSDAELQQLEENLKADGCRDPLVVWNGLLIDGHNRHEICERLGIEYRVVVIDLPGREAACDWIDANQLGRRNLTADAFKLYLGRRYNRAKKQNGERGKEKLAQNDPASTAEVLAKQHGVSPATVKRDAKFAEEVERDPDLDRAVKERKPVLQVKREKKEKNRERRREENRQLIDQTPTPTEAVKAGAKFSTIVIDPPWDWGDEGDADQLGRARPTYGTMSFEELKSLPVGKLADEDCHIYLWITNRSLPKGFALLEAWGFRYITCLTWCKPSIGMGNYFRGSSEQILFGVKGSQPLKRKDIGTWFSAPRGPNGHSSKPLESYDLIESCSPGPYVEMFARSNRPSWTAWGAEAK